MAYSKSKAAKKLGISKDELEKRAKKAGFDTTEAYYNFIGGAAAPIISQIKKQIIELDRQLDKLPSLALTDQEKENFLQKAISQVQPYYDRKVAEITQGVQEGKIRSAEDTLLYIRDVENEVGTTLANLDLSKAETEEDFINTLTQITAGLDENLDTKREDWRLRIENLKQNQIQSGIFSSGIGKEKREEAARLQQMEESQLQAGAQRQITGAETAKKYTLDQITLARQAAEKERVARIGAEDQTAAQKAAAMGILGITDPNQLGSKTAIDTARMSDARNISVYKPEALQEIEAERLKAAESRKQELQDEELAIRNQEYERQRQKILADKAAAQAKLNQYGAY